MFTYHYERVRTKKKSSKILNVIVHIFRFQKTSWNRKDQELLLWILTSNECEIQMDILPSRNGFFLFLHSQNEVLVIHSNIIVTTSLIADKRASLICRMKKYTVDMNSIYPIFQLNDFNFQNEFLCIYIFLSTLQSLHTEMHAIFCYLFKQKMEMDAKVLKIPIITKWAFLLFDEH